MSALWHDELLSRLDHFSVTPSVILDVDGKLDQPHGALRRRFPRARLISTGPLRRIGGWRESILSRWLRRAPQIEYLDSTIQRLPLEDRSIDLVIAYGWTPVIDTLDSALVEIHRVLVSDGLFLCLSPSAGAVTGQADIHDFGSALMRAGFMEPVLDIDRFDDAEHEVIHVAAFAGANGRGAIDGEVVVPFPKIPSR